MLMVGGKLRIWWRRSLFEEKHPGCIGLFCFDQSSNHNSFKEDALVATKMNLGPGGKNIKHMRDGYFQRGLKQF